MHARGCTGSHVHARGCTGSHVHARGCTGSHVPTWFSFTRFSCSRLFTWSQSVHSVHLKPGFGTCDCVIESTHSPILILCTAPSSWQGHSSRSGFGLDHFFLTRKCPECRILHPYFQMSPRETLGPPSARTTSNCAATRLVAIRRSQQNFLCGGGGGAKQ